MKIVECQCFHPQGTAGAIHDPACGGRSLNPVVQIEMRVGLMWSERDVGRMSTRFKLGNRTLSVAMMGSPHIEGRDFAKATSLHHTIMLWEGEGPDVTYQVLGVLEADANERFAQAMRWLLDAEFAEREDDGHCGDCGQCSKCFPHRLRKSKQEEAVMIRENILEDRKEGK